MSHLSQWLASMDKVFEKKTAYPPTKTNSEFTLEISCFEGLSPNLSSSPSGVAETSFWSLPV